MRFYSIGRTKIALFYSIYKTKTAFLYIKDATEPGPRFIPFHGGFGLLTIQCINKPVFYSYKFINMLGQADLSDTDSCLWNCKKIRERHAGAIGGFHQYASEFNNTSIRYPVHFDSGERKIYLKGEAYFVIAKDKRPFTVVTERGVIKDYGTEFNVNTFSPSNTKVVLVKGKVSVTPTGNFNHKESFLKTGQLACLNKNDSSNLGATSFTCRQILITYLHELVAAYATSILLHITFMRQL